MPLQVLGQVAKFANPALGSQVQLDVTGRDTSRHALERGKRLRKLVPEQHGQRQGKDEIDTERQQDSLPGLADFLHDRPLVETDAQRELAPLAQAPA